MQLCPYKLQVLVLITLFFLPFFLEVLPRLLLLHQFISHPTLPPPFSVYNYQGHSDRAFSSSYMIYMARYGHF